MAIGVVYWRGPARRPAWRLLTPGAVLASLSFMLTSVGFSYYVERFGSFDKTYGSLAAAAIVLVWLYFGAYLVLLGAEINRAKPEVTPVV